MPVTINARIETVPPEDPGPAPDRRTDQVSATAETYELALEQVQAAVPDGWRLMHVLVDRSPLG